MKRDSQPQDPLLLSRAEVERLCGLSTSSLYRAMRQGHFPEPLRIGVRAVRWRSDEIASWIETRPRASGIVGTAACARARGDSAGAGWPVAGLLSAGVAQRVWSARDPITAPGSSLGSSGTIAAS